MPWKAYWRGDGWVVLSREGRIGGGRLSYAVEGVLAGGRLGCAVAWKAYWRGDGWVVLSRGRRIGGGQPVDGLLLECIVEAILSVL